MDTQANCRLNHEIRTFSWSARRSTTLLFVLVFWKLKILVATNYTYPEPTPNRPVRLRGTEKQHKACCCRKLPTPRN